MTQYNEMYPSDPAAAVNHAWQEQADRLLESPEAATDAIRIVKETADAAGPGDHHRLVHGFQRLARSYRRFDETSES